MFYEDIKKLIKLKEIATTDNNSHKSSPSSNTFKLDLRKVCQQKFN